MTKSLSFLIIFLWILPHFGFSQEAYNNCTNAIHLCANQIYPLHNINSDADICTGCEDDYSFCFTPEHTIWAKFNTDENGSDVDIYLNNITFNNPPSGNPTMQFVVIQATTPCDPNTYKSVSSCENIASSSYNLSLNTLLPNTSYYIIFNTANDNGTPVEVQFEIQVSGTDFILDAGEDLTIEEGESIALQGSTTADVFNWTPPIFMENATSIHPIVSPVIHTTYQLTGTKGNCTIMDEMTVFVTKQLTIPNTFTPNDDGINDYWEILGVEQYPNCHIQIFSRWGQLVYEVNGYPEEKWWDGTDMGGSNLPSATYYYVIKTQKETLKGIVTLIR